MKSNEEIRSAILLRLKGPSRQDHGLNPTDLPEFPKQDVVYNMMLLIGEGYIKGTIQKLSTGDGRVSAYADRLTLRGETLLESLREKFNY